MPSEQEDHTHSSTEETDNLHGSISSSLRQGKYASQYDCNDKGEKEKEDKRFSFWQNHFPDGYLSELREVAKLAAPMILIQFSQMIIGPVAIMFCGHLGKEELDAVSLAVSIINVTVLSSATGLATACDTIFSQTYGSEHKDRLGICLQRSLLMLTMVVFPVWALYLNAGDILVLLGQNFTISWMVDSYMKLYMPGALFFYVYITFAKYLQTQNIVLPSVIIGIIINLLNAALHYLLVYYFNLGIYGSAIALDLTYFVLLLLTFIYIIVFKVYKDTWSGWRRECLADWGVFGKVAFFGLLMICFEWWAFEFAIFASGAIGTTELGAQSIIYQYESVWYMLPFGTGIAASIRVGQFLGGSKPVNARAAAWVSLSVMTCIAVLMAILFTTLRNFLPYVFTEVPEVVTLAATVFPVLGLFTVVDALSGVGTGVMRGCGRQAVGTIVIAVGYTAAMAVGIPVMLYSSLGIISLWICLVSAVGVEALVILILIIKTDWELEVKKAHERIKISEVSKDENDTETNSLITKPKYQTFHNETTPGDKPLSMKRLLLLRSLIYLVFLLIFVGGVLCRLAVHDGQLIVHHNETMTSSLTTVSTVFTSTLSEGATMT